MCGGGTAATAPRCPSSDIPRCDASARRAAPAATAPRCPSSDVQRRDASARRAAHAQRPLRGGGTATTALHCPSAAPITPRRVSLKSCTHAATAAWRRHCRQCASLPQQRHSTAGVQELLDSRAQVRACACQQRHLPMTKPRLGHSTSVPAASKRAPAELTAPVTRPVLIPPMWPISSLRIAPRGASAAGFCHTWQFAIPLTHEGG